MDVYETVHDLVWARSRRQRRPGPAASGRSGQAGPAAPSRGPGVKVMGSVSGERVVVEW